MWSLAPVVLKQKLTRNCAAYPICDAEIATSRNPNSERDAYNRRMGHMQVRTTENGSAGGAWHKPTRAARTGVKVLLWGAIACAATSLTVMTIEDTPLDAARRRELSLAHLAFMGRTFTLHAALAMVFFAAIALLMRMRVAATLCGVLAVGFAMPVLSLLAFRKPDARPVDPSRELRIVSMNVLLTNPDAQAAIAFIRDKNPDVILVQEHTPAWHKAMADEFAHEYSFIVNEMRGNAFGQAVFSKRPFVEEPVKYLSARTQATSDRVTGVIGLHDPQIRVVIDLAGTPVVIQNVHVVPPADVSLFREQRAQVAELAAIAKSENRPLVMAGDFNATANSRLVTKLLDDGMRDANAVAGSGLSHTWPDIGPLRFLPGIRIDHVLTSSNIRVHEHLVGPSIGSDHRPLFVCISMQ